MLRTRLASVRRGRHSRLPVALAVSGLLLLVLAASSSQAGAVTADLEASRGHAAPQPSHQCAAGEPFYVLYRTDAIDDGEPVTSCEPVPLTAPAGDTAPVPDVVHTMGDADCDEDIDSVDALTVLRNVAGLGADSSCTAAGDLNCDSELQATDGLGILRYLASLPAAPVVGCPSIGTGDLAIMTLEKFGQGSVDGSFDCDTTCSLRRRVFTLGSELVLDAQASGGWFTYPWEGCTDLANAGTTCNVTVSADTVLRATFVSDAPLQLASNLTVLPEDVMQSLTGEDGDPATQSTLLFAPGSALLTGLQDGDVIASSDAANAFLRRVLDVRVGPAEIAIDVEPAGLADAFSDGTLIVTQSLDQPLGNGSAAAPSGGTGSAACPQHYVGGSFNLNLAPLGEASGQACGRLGLDIKLSFNPWELSVSMDGDASLVGRATAPAKAGHGEEFKLADLPATHVSLGFFPITITHELFLNAGISAEAGVDVGLDLSGGFDVGFKCDKDGCSTFDNGKSSRASVAVHKLDGAAKVSIGPTLKSKLWGLGGVVLGASPFAKVTFKAENQNTKVKLSAGMDATLGIEGGLGGLFGFLGNQPQLATASSSIPVFEIPVHEWLLNNTFHTLNVGVTPNAGVVTSRPPAIHCGGNSGGQICTADYLEPAGTEVRLTASLLGSHLFVGWDGCDSVSGDFAEVCQVAMTSGRSPFATYERLPVVWVTSKQGSITFSPGGSPHASYPGTCGLNPLPPTTQFGCPRVFGPNTNVTLTASPNGEWELDSWEGCDSVSGASGEVCHVALGEDARSVEAKYFVGRTLLAWWHSGVTVSSDPPHFESFNCQNSVIPICSATNDYSFDSQVQLTAQPPEGSRLTGWHESCSSDVTDTGFADTLRSCESQGCDFDGVSSCRKGCDWVAGNSQQSTCSVRMRTDRFVHPQFAPARSLTIAVQGAGVVSTQPVDLLCAEGVHVCTGAFEPDSTVTLNADPAFGYAVEWQGCTPIPDADQCTVSMNQDRSVNANFFKAGDLVVIVEGPGRVTSSAPPPGQSPIDCPDECLRQFKLGSVVTLTAHPDPGFFVDWSGCDGEPCCDEVSGADGEICTVAVNADRGVLANFTDGSQRTLTIAVSGQGTVSDGLDIDCGPATSCNYLIPSGATKLLQATPRPGWTFSSWAGCDAQPGGVCQIRVESDTTITATFLPLPVVAPCVAGICTLTVIVEGNGLVQSVDDSGVPTNDISCQSGTIGDCSHDYPLSAEALLTLEAVPADGWSVDWAASTCDPDSTTDLAEHDSDLNECYPFMQASLTITIAFVQN